MGFNLSNWKIRSKLLLLVGVMAGLVAAVAGTGIYAMGNMGTSMGKIMEVSEHTLVGARLNQNVIRLNRAEYRIASDPSADNVREALSVITEQRKELEERFAKLKAAADPEQQKLLTTVDQTYRTYIADLEETLAKAKEHGGKVALGDAQRIIVDAVKAGRPIADKLTATVKAFTDFTDGKSDKIQASAESSASWIETVLIAVAVLGVVGGVAFGYLLATYGIGKPLAASVGNLKQLASGDLKVEIFGVGRKDEIGDIAGTLQVFKDSMTEAERLRAEQAKEQAIREERAKKIETAVAEFEAAAKSVVGIVSSSATEMQAAAQSLSATAEQTSRQATAVAAASEQASTNVQTVATAGEELSSSISEISRQVGQSTHIAGQAVEEAGRTNAKVQGLAEAAQRIGDVVKLINDIAGQTNLLALNATIEAARAGEAGKGFAVVASEVKSLANQTAKATDEIAAQISAIQGATKDSVDAIQSIGRTIGEVNEIATTIAAAVEEQGAATAEIARNVQQAARGTQEVSSNIGGVTQASAATGSAASQVLSAAGELAHQAETLRLQVDTFLNKVRAA